MAIYTVITWSLSIRTYLVIDEISGRALVIDPTRHIEPILEFLEEKGGELLYILESHVHADFVSGARELKAHFGGKPIIACSALGGEEWIPKYCDQLIQDKTKFELGPLVVEAWHTPGHTPEHLMFVLFEAGTPIATFTGDFLFAGSVGRPDLLGEGKVNHLAKQLYQSIFETLPKLPENLRVLPAHGSGSLCGKGIASQEESTLEKEWKSNPLLRKIEPEKWMVELLSEMPKAPAYFSRLKKVNITGAPFLNTLAPIKQISPEAFTELDKEKYVLLDVRNQEQFATQHVKKSVNIPWSANFLRWAGEFIGTDIPIIILANNRDEITEVIKALHLIGIDNIEGFTLIEKALWNQPNCEAASFLMPEGIEILSLLPGFTLIDVRTTPEWMKGHISGAIHHEITNLQEIINQIEKNKPIAFVCGSGYRASIAASFAEQAGFTNIFNIKGGMQTWNQFGLPIEIT